MRSLVEDEFDRLGMYAPRQRGVESTSTNRPKPQSYGTDTTVRMSSGGNWIAHIHGRKNHRHRRLCHGSWRESRFDSESRRKGGHSGGATPVPIPNTEVKPTSVPGSTGVSDPLGTAVRRLPIHPGEYSHPDFRPTDTMSVGCFHVYRVIAMRLTTDCFTRSSSQY